MYIFFNLSNKHNSSEPNQVAHINVYQITGQGSSHLKYKSFLVSRQSLNYPDCDHYVEKKKNCTKKTLVVG